MKTANNGQEPGRRIVVVSNRLPFTVAVEEETIRFRPSAGGLVTGLISVLERLKSAPPFHFSEHLWAGWPGTAVEKSLEPAVTARAKAEHNAFPVFLTEREMDNFYFGFCNKTIWPLFHYFPSYVAYQPEHWEEYRRVNEMFCDALLGEMRPDDIVWIHDYHLMLLPKLLKAKMPNLPIGFFLHIPFPSFEIYRLLPEEWRAELLHGLLGADLIGFHTYEYTQHFLQSVVRILGYEHLMGQIALPARTVRAETFPMGIDFQKFSTAHTLPAVAAGQKELRRSLRNVRIILSVDRLDYSKGILNRLEGFELLLEEQPQLHGTVALVMVVVPSRIMVNQYEQMKRQIEEYVGRINGKFGTMSWTPIIYQYRQLGFEQLCALYTGSDVALVTPLRDGMNLVAKEYVASRADSLGVLILSEMAGAAQELREAVIINPNNRRATAQAMYQALEMPPEDQRRRNDSMRLRIQRYDIVRWAEDFLTQLFAMQEVQTALDTKLLREPDRRRLVHDFAHSAGRLLLLDYDGTLASLVRRPEFAVPKPGLLDLLRRLAAIPRTTVVIISGRSRFQLEQWFGALDLALVAEHGAWIKECSREEWKAQSQLPGAWKAQILPILELYADRLPGALVEEKEFSVAWHYRSADPEQAAALARQLADHLTTFTANIDLQVMRGSKVIEIRNSGVNKGAAARHWLATNAHEFILAAGDDWTDEDLFAVLPPTAFSIRVGAVNTRATHNLHHPGDVLRLLEELTHTSPSPE